MTDLCKVIHCRRRSRPQVTGDSASGDGRLSESVPHTVSTNDPRHLARPLPPYRTLSLFLSLHSHPLSPKFIRNRCFLVCWGFANFSLFVYFCTRGNPVLCVSSLPTRLATSSSSPFQHPPPSDTPRYIVPLVHV